MRLGPERRQAAGPGDDLGHALDRRGVVRARVLHLAGQEDDARPQPGEGQLDASHP